MARYTARQVHDFMDTARNTNRRPIPRDLPPLTAADGTKEPPLPHTHPDDDLIVHTPTGRPHGAREPHGRHEIGETPWK